MTPKFSKFAPYSPTDFGRQIVRKGGHDDQSPDDMLFLELAQRMPGLTFDEYQGVFVAIMEEYGENALAALREGYIQIEEVKGGTRPDGKGEAQ